MKSARESYRVACPLACNITCKSQSHESVKTAAARKKPKSSLSHRGILIVTHLTATLNIPPKPTVSHIMDSQEDQQMIYEFIKSLFDGLDDLLAMRRTLKPSELNDCSDLIASYITNVEMSTPIRDEEMSPMQSIKILKQITQTRSKMMEDHLDTTMMDQMVKGTILALKSRLAKQADFPKVITRPTTESRSAS